MQFNKCHSIQTADKNAPEVLFACESKPNHFIARSFPRVSRDTALGEASALTWDSRSPPNARPYETISTESSRAFPLFMRRSMSWFVDVDIGIASCVFGVGDLRRGPKRLFG